MFDFRICVLLFHISCVNMPSNYIIYIFDSFNLCFRDFAAAKLIGADGLHGQSWPDLDMLPFGWLTDAGYKAWFQAVQL